MSRPLADQDSSTANQTCSIRFHVFSLKKLRSLTFATNDIEKNVKIAFFSKIVKNVLNVRYIYGICDNHSHPGNVRLQRTDDYTTDAFNNNNPGLIIYLWMWLCCNLSSWDCLFIVCFMIYKNYNLIMNVVKCGCVATFRLNVIVLLYLSSRDCLSLVCVMNHRNY